MRYVTYVTLSQIVQVKLPAMNPATLKKQTILMDQTACSIKGVTDTLRVQIQILSADIKACEKSKAEFQRHLT